MRLVVLLQLECQGCLPLSYTLKCCSEMQCHGKAKGSFTLLSGNGMVLHSTPCAVLVQVVCCVKVIWMASQALLPHIVQSAVLECASPYVGPAWDAIQMDGTQHTICSRIAWRCAVRYPGRWCGWPLFSWQWPNILINILTKTIFTVF